MTAKTRRGLGREHFELWQGGRGRGVVLEGTTENSRTMCTRIRKGNPILTKIRRNGKARLDGIGSRWLERSRKTMVLEGTSENHRFRTSTYPPPPGDRLCSGGAQGVQAAAPYVMGSGAEEAAMGGVGGPGRPKPVIGFHQDKCQGNCIKPPPSKKSKVLFTMTKGLPKHQEKY